MRAWALIQTRPAAACAGSAYDNLKVMHLQLQQSVSAILGAGIPLPRSAKVRSGHAVAHVLTSMHACMVSDLLSPTPLISSSSSSQEDLSNMRTDLVGLKLDAPAPQLQPLSQLRKLVRLGNIPPRGMGSLGRRQGEPKRAPCCAEQRKVVLTVFWASQSRNASRRIRATCAKCTLLPPNPRSMARPPMLKATLMWWRPSLMTS